MLSKGLVGQRPITFLFPDKPLFNLVPHVFGCLCFIHVLGPGTTKLNPHAIHSVFLGYSTTQKGYRCYDLPEKFMFERMSL